MARDRGSDAAATRAPPKLINDRGGILPSPAAAPTPCPKGPLARTVGFANGSPRSPSAGRASLDRAPVDRLLQPHLDRGVWGPPGSLQHLTQISQASPQLGLRSITARSSIVRGGGRVCSPDNSMIILPIALPNAPAEIFCLSIVDHDLGGVALTGGSVAADLRK